MMFANREGVDRVANLLKDKSLRPVPVGASPSSIGLAHFIRLPMTEVGAFVVAGDCEEELFSHVQGEKPAN